LPTADRIALVDIVVKLGGGVLADPDQFAAALTAIGAAAREQRILVVPGGGPFADAVREVDRRMALSDTVAHWMAVLAMEQYAHLIAARLADAALAADPAAIVEAIAAHRVPVLAPYQWLRATDPLPHSWDVTSDSIAAWVSGFVHARRLVLVKPSAIRLSVSPPVDAYFDRALPRHIPYAVVPADQLHTLDAALRGD
jgi:5-(aminomethyl)-3-furanmethanol phosphate kinase